MIFGPNGMPEVNRKTGGPCWRPAHFETPKSGFQRWRFMLSVNTENTIFIPFWFYFKKIHGPHKKIHGPNVGPACDWVGADLLAIHLQFFFIFCVPRTIFFTIIFKKIMKSTFSKHFWTWAWADHNLARFGRLGLKLHRSKGLAILSRPPTFQRHSA